VPKLSIGLLGAGQVARRHVAAFSARSDCRLTAVHDPAGARADELAATVNGLDVVSSPSALLGKEIDAVVITAPTQHHYQLGIAALRAGKHVLMEKPFTRNTDEALALDTVAGERGLVIMPAQVTRFLPAVLEMRRRLEQDDPGPLVQAVERRFTHRTEVRPWWRELPEFLIAHWGSHSLDVFLWLTGSEADDVVCWGSSRQSGYDGIDDFTLVVRSTSNAVISLHQTYSSRIELLDWVVVWESATGVIDGLTDCTWNGDALVSTDLETALRAAFDGMADEFVRCCTGGTELRTNVQSVLPSLRVIDRAIRSAGLDAHVVNQAGAPT
jgi:predicted dehydrogenase